MKVIVDHKVHCCIEEFYDSAKRKHITLDMVAIIHKIQRIYKGLEDLGNYAFICPNPRLRKDWIDKGYKECIIEDFHFAFQLCRDSISDEYYVYVYDACHSLLYYDK